MEAFTSFPLKMGEKRKKIRRRNKTAAYTFWLCYIIMKGFGSRKKISVISFFFSPIIKFFSMVLQMDDLEYFCVLKYTQIGNLALLQ